MCKGKTSEKIDLIIDFKTSKLGRMVNIRPKLRYNNIKFGYDGSNG